MMLAELYSDNEMPDAAASEYEIVLNTICDSVFDIDSERFLKNSVRGLQEIFGSHSEQIIPVYESVIPVYEQLSVNDKQWLSPLWEACTNLSVLLKQNCPDKALQYSQKALEISREYHGQTIGSTLISEDCYEGNMNTSIGLLNGTKDLKTLTDLILETQRFRGKFK